MVHCGLLWGVWTLSRDRPSPPPWPQKHGSKQSLTRKERAVLGSRSNPFCIVSARSHLASQGCFGQCVCVGGVHIVWWSCLILPQTKKLPCYKKVGRTERGREKGNSENSQHFWVPTYAPGTVPYLYSLDTVIHLVFLTSPWCRHCCLYVSHRGGDWGTEEKQHDQNLNLSNLTPGLALWEGEAANREVPAMGNC